MSYTSMKREFTEEIIKVSTCKDTNKNRIKFYSDTLKYNIKINFENKR